MHAEFAHIGADDVPGRVIEEASELILAISKAKRFGWFEWWRDNPMNYQMVLNEISDCKIQFELLEEHIKQLVDIEKVLQTPASFEIEARET